VELRHLRYFIKSAELLHFTEAAAALNVSQPNLSLQIQQLEEELGSRLFDRVGRAVHLTAAGELFLVYAQRALREVESGQRGIHDLEGLLRGKLRIGVTNSFNTKAFPALLVEFVRTYPVVHVSVTVAANRCVETGVRDGNFDLGLVCQSSTAFDFNSMESFKQDIVVAVSRAHPLAGSATVRIRDLAGIPLGLPTLDNAARQLIDNAFGAAGITPEVIVETNDNNVLIGLAEHDGAAAILAWESKTRLACGSVSIIRLSDMGLSLTAAFIWPRSGHSSSPAARFLELVVDRRKRPK
jgi:LysR family cyn operon transcriptional activator